MFCDKHQSDRLVFLRGGSGVFPVWLWSMWGSHAEVRHGSLSQDTDEYVFNELVMDKPHN